MPLFKANKRPTVNREPKQLFPHYSHTPFGVSENKTSISVDEKGKTKIVQEHDEDEYAEVAVSATFINLLNKLSPILKERRLTLHMSEQGLKLSQENDNSSDDVECSLDLIEKASQIIRTTRKIEMKDEPYKED